MWHANRTPKQEQGRLWEERALTYLRRQGLVPVETNFRCKGGELDLIMRDGDALVFVEVRQREGGGYGGAAASVSPAKIRRLVLAARVYLQRVRPLPPCRFDLVAIDGMHIEWLKNIIDV